MADIKKSIYPNTYKEGEFLSPSDVRRGQELINTNIPLGLGSASTIPMAQPTRMPTMIPSTINQPIPEPQDDESGRFLASLIAQGAAGFGTGIMGGSAADIQRSGSQFQTMRDTQETQRKAKLLTDPNSEESKRRRNLYESLGYQVPNNLSATDLNDPTVLQTLKTQMQEQKLAAMPRGGIGIGGTGKPKEEKEKKNPFQKEINFINIYSKNGIQALDELKKLIQTKGTSELIGSSGTKMDQYIRDIAIAKTKILDPNSVISQGEIDSVKKTLGLDDYSRPFISNKSALESLDNFKNILINNRNNAINTLESLPSEESFNDKEKFIIESYRNNPDDPDTKRAYDNMLKSKGR